ncbi:hypothetical protein FMH10_23440 [Vibrio parahaemolyticus]|nr:hypothetical protein [Vibrio parahaemolyticus]EGR0316210.1 hypothetical protein [Vibrio parahaemolyticus]
MLLTTLQTGHFILHLSSYDESNKKANARLSGEQRYHDTQLLHRKHKNQIKLKPPSVANPS